jgi:signal transduction histidine kinase
MKRTLAAAAIPLVILLLTWLSQRAADTKADLFDHALTALDRLSMAESALHRDVLSARTGMLRDYDPLVQDVNAVDASLDRLRRTAPVDTATTAVVDRLAASITRQEEMVEQFKSENALLQNSLAHFGRFSSSIGMNDQIGPVVPTAATLLAAAVLRLTLDTSPMTVRGVQDRLDELANSPLPPADMDAVRALLAHGQLLHDLLPETDRILKAMSAMPRKHDQAALRALIVADEAASRRVASHFRLLLYAASLLLVGLLVHLGLRLRARARALQRSAAFEHTIAGISMRFINTQAHDLDENIDRALAEMAQCVGANRAYFVVSGPGPRKHVWCTHGTSFPPDWPEQAQALAARFGPTADGIVHLPQISRLPPGEIRDACKAVGLQGWACATTTSRNGIGVLLGFDAIRQPCRITEPGELGLLRTGLDTIANAVGRQLIERETARLEAQLQQARRMETVGALASGIAHNFNNILGAILGYVEIAEGLRPSNGQITKNLTEIRRAGERARDLVDQILAFGRRRDAKRGPASVQNLVSETASLLRVSWPAGIDLVIREAPREAIVRGEASQLQQVILNLCRNAAEAVDGAGKVEVEIDLRQIDRSRALSDGELRPGRYVCFVVSDTGRGMSVATLRRIFEPFFTTRLTGNGLGLMTVREIVRDHGGAMNVSSTLGVGSRFEVWLPCMDVVAPTLRDDQPTSPFGRGETVLMVESARDCLLANEEMLAAVGYEPVGFNSAADALAACRAAPQRFDAAVVGRLVPAMSALDLSAALHDIVPDLPILLGRSLPDEIRTNELIAAGVCEVVSWPLAASEIVSTLARCLASPEIPVGELQ